MMLMRIDIKNENRYAQLQFIKLFLFNFLFSSRFFHILSKFQSLILPYISYQVLSVYGAVKYVILLSNIIPVVKVVFIKVAWKT